MRASLSLALAAAAMAVTAARAAPAAPDMTEFYTGRTVAFVIGVADGAYARTIGRHMVRYVPGHPTVQFEEATGDASRKAAAALFGLAPGDGLTIGAILPQAIMDPLVDPPADKPAYDPLKFEYLGSASSAVYVCIAERAAPASTFEQARKRPLIMGASRSGGPTRTEALMLMNLLGANFRLVPGYTDRDQILRALTHGEVHGLCGYSWWELKRDRAGLLADNKVNLLLQFSLDGHRELDKLGVPHVWTYVKDARDRAAFEVMATGMLFARPFVAPPGTPRAQVNALRVAFERTMRDVDFRADAHKNGLDITPTTGEVVQRLVEKLFKTPDDVLQRLREARRMKPPGEG